MSSAVKQQTSFFEDKKGAIMVLGIFMACVMIGWMWMLVGLGDAMIWRDRSQEAADAMAYSSAAVQAKGMNFISFLNAVMLIITAIYLVLALVFNVIDLFHVIFGNNDDGSWWIQDSCSGTRDDIAILGVVCAIVPGLEEFAGPLEDLASEWCDWAGTFETADKAMANALTKYESFMTSTLPYISDAEDLVAYGAPWAGVVTGGYVGYKYVDWDQHHMGLPLSATMIPAKIFPAPVKKWDANDPHKEYTGRDAREGLPVQIPDEGMSELCTAAAQTVLAPIGDFFGKIPVLGWLIKTLIDGVADKLKEAYCHKDSEGLFSPFDSDIYDVLKVGRWAVWARGGPGPNHDIYQIKKGSEPFWQNPDKIGGPHVMVPYAANGNDWMQVWGMVYGGNRPEQSENKVGLAGMNFSASPNSEGGMLGGILQGGFRLYFAQAEFYFDCEDVWSNDECNGGTNAGNKASYRMNWRTRMRRIHGISWGQDLLGWIWGTSFAGKFDDRAKKWVSNTGLFQSLSDKIGEWKSNTLLNGAYGDLKDYAGDKVGGMIDPATTIPDTIH